MNANYNPDTIPPATAKRRPIGTRAALAAALLSGGLALAGLGLASGTAQAAAGPAPQGRLVCHSNPDFCDWSPFDDNNSNNMYPSPSWYSPDPLTGVPTSDF
jgi:hypothetical protein